MIPLGEATARATTPIGVSPNRVSRDAFGLLDCAAQSFGVLKEQPIDVVLRFAEAARPRSVRCSFHRLQSTARKVGGSLPVCFRGLGSMKPTTVLLLKAVPLSWVCAERKHDVVLVGRPGAQARYHASICE